VSGTSNDHLSDRELGEALRAREEHAGCPSEERWLDLLAGRIGGAEADRLRQHLADCSRCTEAARDARRFLIAFEQPIARAAERWPIRWRIAAAAALAAGIVGLLLFFGDRERAPAGAVERLIAEIDLPAHDLAGGGAGEPDLVYRGGASERGASLDEALAPYRARRFGDACTALDEHARRFPADREGRYFAGVACLEAGELERADERLAALAASAGERREEARELLARLRRARAGDPR
jgi:hypothetical protein